MEVGGWGVYLVHSVPKHTDTRTHTLAPCDQQSDKKHPRREQAQRQLTIEEHEKERYAAAYGYLGDDDAAVIW